MLNNQILNFCKNNFIRESEMKNYIDEPEISKLKLFLSDKELNKYKFNSFDKSLKYIPFISGTFNKYLYNLSSFVCSTYENFCGRFVNNLLKDEKKYYFLLIIFFLYQYIHS